ncbi:HlyD family efflux transporter periplasmic adaptor subunit [Escherichia coli]
MRWWRNVRRSSGYRPDQTASGSATVRAPFDGRVISLKTSVGQFASAMRPIFTLIDTRHWYVIANFRETDLKNIVLRYTRNHSPDERQRQNLQGKVDRIGYARDRMTAAWCWAACRKCLVLLTGSGVAQRFPVKIMVDKPDPERSASALRQSLILSRNNERAQLPAITGGQAAGVLS